MPSDVVDQQNCNADARSRQCWQATIRNKLYQWHWRHHLSTNRSNKTPNGKDNTKNSLNRVCYEGHVDQKTYGSKVGSHWQYYMRHIVVLVQAKTVAHCSVVQCFKTCAVSEAWSCLIHAIQTSQHKHSRQAKADFRMATGVQELRYSTSIQDCT